MKPRARIATIEPAIERADESALVLERVRCAARLRAGWLARFTNRLEATAEDRDSPELEFAWRTDQPDCRHLATLTETLRSNTEGRLKILQGLFGLADHEADILQTCLALDLDPGLAGLFEAISGTPAVTTTLVARLFGHGRATIVAPTSPLLRWALVGVSAAAASRAFFLDPALRPWLAGDSALDPALLPHAFAPAIHPPLPAWPVRALAGGLDEALRRGEHVRLVIAGATGSGRHTLATAVATVLGLPLLAIDTDRIEATDWPAVFMRVQRQAFLDRCAIAWHGEDLARRPWHDASAFPVEFIIAQPGQALPATDAAERRYTLPMLTAADRRALWLHHLPGARTWPETEIADLAERYHALPGEIAQVARTRPARAVECTAALRASVPPEIRELGDLLDSDFEWDDLVVPQALRASLEDLAFEARARDGFWENVEARRLFPQGRGLIALFSGPAGTGKTMAAQVVAAQLGLTLCKVNLSQIFSKWVGEAAQRMERLLVMTRQRPMALLFDEADAIYGKRVTDTKTAQDRYANMDLSHLMMAIEAFDGIVILTTNLESNIDPAFLRRIRYSLEFEKPGPDDRALIWRKVVTGLHGTRRAQALAKTWPKLAAIEATGAQIKNAVLSASFIAARAGGPIALPHLVAGLNREFAKEGYALSDRQLAGVRDG